MTAEVSIDLRQHGRGDSVTSPELVLVDPDLGARARAQLPDAPSMRAVPTALPPRLQVVAADAPVAPLRRELSAPRRTDDRRLLLGCAALTVLMLLLVDLRGGIAHRVPTGVIPAVPPAGPSSEPPQSPPPSKPIDRRFVWAATSNASRYHVEFFRGAERVFVRDTIGTDVVVPARWTYAGRRRSLQPGEYTWYVWPIVAGKRASSATVRATVAITR